MERQSTSRRGTPARARVGRTFRELCDAPNLDRVGQQEPHEAGNFYAKRGEGGLLAADSSTHTIHDHEHDLAEEEGSRTLRRPYGLPRGFEVRRRASTAC